MASVGLALFMTVLDSSIANVALPTIARDFGARPAESIWIINAYQLAIVTTLLAFASLGEIVGFRKVYLAGLAVFTLASLACAMSHNLVELTAARALQGLGASGVMSVNGGLIRFIWPHRLLGRGIGLNALVISVSAAIGPTIASGILALGPWPWLFAINIPIGVAAVFVAFRALPSNPLSGRPFDVVSAALNAATFGLIIYGVDVVTRTRAKLWGALTLAAGAIAATALVRREWPRKRPLAPFDLLRDPIFALSVATSVVTFTAQLLAFVSLPFRFENSLHFNQVYTGLLLTPWPVAVGICAPISGALSDRLSTAVLCAIGLLILAGGLTALVFLPAHPAPLDIVWRMAACGAGFGIFQAPNNRMMLTAAPRERAGAAGGMLGTARLTGQTMGAVLTAVFFELFAAKGEVICLAVGAACALAAAGFSLARLGVRRTDGPGAQPSATTGS
ncbi:MAG TPA: MFS transporter [Caulobacteraceae bacterium]|nr:MFS transporter [Caulobacteraceae bacterium]